MKPYAESCDQNRVPILDVLREVFATVSTVLEIGSGTGQHAVYFGADLPHVRWITSDRTEHHPGIRQWLREAALPNVEQPRELDVDQTDWGLRGQEVDAVFSANTAHIMGLDSVARMFDGVGRLLPAGGVFVLYGPFNYHGAYTSDSNARFDAWLQQRDPASGIKDFETLDRFATDAGMVLWHDVPMPVNNRSLVWRKLPSASQTGGRDRPGSSGTKQQPI